MERGQVILPRNDEILDDFIIYICRTFHHWNFL